ncbi:hypothetical protein LMG3458_04079 [Achromobacter deleyi]|uniref:Uncharacterized protein n=2 Tax=Achromobacter deleyi TaxID=1353891 RepID=A0A6S7AAF3_9BURK|nr:hypothetical protein LMG3458_04079 [Achromobacter deleyi]CAB3877923.1 hypothetical protein LMG3481_03104 [Achromobacter deleyi]CAB3898506.1 hypothetical protein LMG3482_04177 [Achromobacter deleyi]
MAPQRYTGVSRASRLVGLGRRAASGLMAATLAALAATAHADADPIVAERSATVLPGSGHSWGFAALAQDGRHVLLARRENGLTIWDAARREALPDIPGTEGANAAVAVPAADRLYVAAMDGSVIVIRASDRQVLKRVPVDSGNLNNALFDPASGQVLLTSGRRGAVSRVYRLDPACDCVRASLDLPAAKLDAPVLLGPGRIALPMRDEGRIAVIDLRRMALLQVWQPPQCARPSALAADAAGKRLFVACRGATPRLLSLDAQSGAVLASAPAGRDINALAYDDRRGWLLAPSGADARLSIYDVSAPAGLRRVASIGTRPWAHNMAYDADRGIAYLPSMDDTEVYPAGGGEAQRHFAADSFTLTTLRLQAPQRHGVERQADQRQRDQGQEVRP